MLLSSVLFAGLLVYSQAAPMGSNTDQIAEARVLYQMGENRERVDQILNNAGSFRDKIVGTTKVEVSMAQGKLRNSLFAVDDDTNREKTTVQHKLSKIEENARDTFQDKDNKIRGDMESNVSNVKRELAASKKEAVGQGTKIEGDLVEAQSEASVLVHNEVAQKKREIDNIVTTIRRNLAALKSRGIEEMLLGEDEIEKLEREVTSYTHEKVTSTKKVVDSEAHKIEQDLVGLKNTVNKKEVEIESYIDRLNEDMDNLIENKMKVINVMLNHIKDDMKHLLTFSEKKADITITNMMRSLDKLHTATQYIVHTRIADIHLKTERELSILLKNVNSRLTANDLNENRMDNELLEILKNKQKSTRRAISQMEEEIDGIVADVKRLEGNMERLLKLFKKVP